MDLVDFSQEVFEKIKKDYNDIIEFLPHQQRFKYSIYSYFCTWWR